MRVTRATALGRIAIAAGGALILLGFIGSRIAPAVLGVGLLLYLRHTRWAARRSFAETRPAFTRRILETVLHERATFHVELDPSRSNLGTGVEMTFLEVTPESIVAESAPSGSGLVPARYAAVPHDKGSHVFTHVDVTLTDARGFWEEKRDIKTRTTAQVLASLDAIQAGRHLARRDPLDASARSPVGMLVRDLEFESIREFSPGDRLRDVDWKRVALYDRLLTKTWEKDLEATVMLLVDAGRSMRARPTAGNVTKLDHAGVLALELAEAASERNHRVGYVTFDERGRVDEMQPTRDRSLPRRLAARLSAVPGAIDAPRRLDVAPDMVERSLDMPFLDALAGLEGTPGDVRTGVRLVVDRLVRSVGDGKLFIVLFTDLEQTPTETLRALRHAASGNHRVIAVVLPGSRFYTKPGTVRARDLENAYREEQNRAQARSVLLAAGVQLLELGPDDTAALVVKASHASKRQSGGPR